MPPIDETTVLVGAAMPVTMEVTAEAAVWLISMLSAVNATCWAFIVMALMIRCMFGHPLACRGKR
jgi:hypothetical protein